MNLRRPNRDALTWRHSCSFTWDAIEFAFLRILTCTKTVGYVDGLRNSMKFSGVGIFEITQVLGDLIAMHLSDVTPAVFLRGASEFSVFEPINTWTSTKHRATEIMIDPKTLCHEYEIKLISNHWFFFYTFCHRSSKFERHEAQPQASNIFKTYSTFSLRRSNSAKKFITYPVMNFIVIDHINWIRNSRIRFQWLKQRNWRRWAFQRKNRRKKNHDKIPNTIQLHKN